MAKKPNPNASFSQTLSAEQKLNYKRALVQAQDGLFYLFADASKTVAIINPAKVYDNFDAFLKEDDQRVVSLYATAFEEEPSKALLKDMVELRVMVWMRLCQTALNRLDAAKPDRAAKLADRSYEVISLEVPETEKLPPQARMCLTFFAELMAADAAFQAIPAEERGVWSIKEKDFNDYVVKNAERLRTRQDPWRIFQYYRPELIKRKLIRLV